MNIAGFSAIQKCGYVGVISGIHPLSQQLENEKGRANSSLPFSIHIIRTIN
jgi:hypothetical protein